MKLKLPAGQRFLYKVFSRFLKPLVPVFYFPHLVFSVVCLCSQNIVFLCPAFSLCYCLPSWKDTLPCQHSQWVACCRGRVCRTASHCLSKSDVRARTCSHFGVTAFPSSELCRSFHSEGTFHTAGPHTHGPSSLCSWPSPLTEEGGMGAVT